MAMDMGTMILAIGMPIITIIILLITVMIKGIFQKHGRLIWGLIISLGLFNLAMILEHTGVVSSMILAWSHIVLPIGAYLIYMDLK